MLKDQGLALHPVPMSLAAGGLAGRPQLPQLGVESWGAELQPLCAVPVVVLVFCRGLAPHQTQANPTTWIGSPTTLRS